MSFQNNVPTIFNKTYYLFPNDSLKMDGMQKSLINNYVKDGLFNYNFQNAYINQNPASEGGRNSKSLYESDFFVEPVTIPYKNYEPFPENRTENLTIYEILKPRLRSPKKMEHQIEISTESETITISSDRAKSSMMSKNVTNIDPIHFLEKQANNSGDHFRHLVTASERSDSNYVFDVTSERFENFSESTTLIATTETVFDSHMKSDSSKAYMEHDDIKIKIDSLTARIADTPLVNRGKSKTVDYDRQINETISSFEIHRNISSGKSNANSFLDPYEVKNLQLNNSTNDTDAMAMDASDVITQIYDPDLLRQPKMSDTLSVDNASLKNPKLDPKSFYDYFSKKMYTNTSGLQLPFPEYRPGNLYRYSDIYQRKPVIDVVYTRPTPVFEIFRPKTTTEEAPISSTTFDSMRTSVRVASTFYPNRIQDVTMIFGNAPTTVSSQKPQNRNDEDPDDDEYRDLMDPGFTMEKLAYLLIGTCCGLSILCLCVVVIAIKCRRVVVERRLKSRFRKRMYNHERMKDPSSPWQQQMFDHLMYFRRQPGDSSCSSAATDCNCRCVTWSLGPRNLESSNSSSRPMCGPNNRNSSYLCGQKKLPFGAASTLRYESMLGRNKKPISNPHKNRDSPPNTDSSHENDSLDQDSQDSRDGGVVHCTCIDYNVWPLTPGDVRRGFYGLYPGTGRYNNGECVQHPAVELRTISKDIPPPVTGSNYLDRSEGVVYWSSNDERLI
ncbi:uncharacterized protein LOC129222704 [Uloborus diversus]|uniref:uncharacterized protein LOC129222704 n=1 Tax=Uloborus diversus TaxID=327109 RepID=UPI0024094A2D|nr:uncharacterized protein LOC129222704 [Uloborus diversus]